MRKIIYTLIIGFIGFGSFGQNCNTAGLPYSGDITPTNCDGSFDQFYMADDASYSILNATYGNNYSFTTSGYSELYIEIYDSSSNYITDLNITYDWYTGLLDTVSWAPSTNDIFTIKVYDAYTCVSSGYGFFLDLETACNFIPCSYNSAANNLGNYTPDSLGTITSLLMTSGDMFTFDAIKGHVYKFSTCNNFNWDTQIQLFNSNGNSLIKNIEGNCGGSNNQSELNWLATSSGNFEIQLSEYYCNTTGSPAPFSFEVSSSGKPQFIVNTTSDLGDSNLGDFICDDGTGNCTLRAALEELNYLASQSDFRIQFEPNIDTIFISNGQLNLYADNITVECDSSINLTISFNANSKFYVTGDNVKILNLNFTKPIQTPYDNSPLFYFYCDQLLFQGNKVKNVYNAIKVGPTNPNADYLTNNNKFINNQFDSITSRVFQTSGNSHLFANNEMSNSGVVLSTNDSYIVNNTFSQNSLSCNDNTLSIWSSNQTIPTILAVNTNKVVGLSAPSTTIEVFINNDDACSGLLCQGTIYIGTTTTNSLGFWELENVNLDINSSVIATSTTVNGSTSMYSSCKEVEDNLIHIVNTLIDLDDGTCDNNTCSLREAINASNSDQHSSIIIFNTEGDINLNSKLPELIESNLIIDGNNDININGGSMVSQALSVKTDSIQIKNINFYSFTDTTLYFDNDAFLLDNCEISKGKKAVIFNDSCLIKIRNNTIRNFDSIAILGGGTGEIINNEIYQNYNGISISGGNSSNILMRENSIYCNEISAINLSSGSNGSIQPPTISFATPDSIGGQSQPYSEVEVYTDNGLDCQNWQICQGKYYLGKTLTDSLGNWQLTSEFSLSSTVSSIAISDNISSEFSSCFEILRNIIVVNVLDESDDGICDSNHCSLKEAIYEANQDGVPSEINFSVSGEIFINNDWKYSIREDNDFIIDGKNQDVTIIPNYFAFSIEYVDGVKIKKLKFSGGSRAISMSSESNNVRIDSCTFHNTDISLSSVEGKNYLSNSILDNVNFRAPNNTSITNNIIRNSSQNSLIGGSSGIIYSQNSFYCNTISVNLNNTQITPPEIITVSQTQITGESQPNKIIEIYYHDNTNCINYPGQGKTYIGTTTSDSLGKWSYINSGNVFRLGDLIVTTSTDSCFHTSEFSNIHIVLPDLCELSEEFSMNSLPCSQTGIVLDLKELTDSGTNSTSSCSSSYQSNDAWLKVVVPPTGNFLIRQNLNNTVNAVIEAYSGDCNNLFLELCAEIDSVPHSMTFENFSVGSTVYLRVWDKGNSVVSSTSSALLHLTAHELPLAKSDWELCDEENNYLVNGNPTILSERDANTFIVEYEPNTTPAQIQLIRDSLILNGGLLLDSCLCGGVNPLELWDHDNPVDMEANKRGLRGRTRVDTSNYNYKFEAIEFQVNAYAIGEQYNAKVDMDEEGNFAIVWIDQQRRHNYGRVYKSSGNPITQEFQIGASNKTQYEGEVAMQADGSFVSVWQEINTAIPGATFAIYGRQYDIEGNALAPPFEISKTSACADGCADPLDGNDFAQFGINPSISIDDNGNFIVVWQVGADVWAQKYNASASRVGNLIQLMTTGDNDASPSPSVSMNSSGQFAVTWVAEDSDGKGIWVERFSNMGASMGPAIKVNSFEIGNQQNPDISLADNGSFIIAWESYEQEGTGLDYGIYAQRFHNTGSTNGGIMHVNTYTSDAQKRPSISLMNDGTFFIAWDSYGQDGFEEGIYGQFFDNMGNPIDNEFKLNAFVDPEQERVSTATNGESVVIGTWQDGANDGSFTGIFGQRYEIIDAGGQKVYYPIGTATPSTLLGDELTYPGTIYAPQDSLSSVRVAIIDTGVDPNHPYLSSAMWNNQQVNDPNNCYVNDTLGYDFVNDTSYPIDYDGHGTKVNGIIARDFPNDITLELMNLKFHEFQKGKVFDAVCAIYYAVDNGADIINMSWGFEASEFPAILKKAIQYASDNDVLMVTTAGNTSKDNDKLNKFPCNLDIPNMIRVTSYEYKSSNNTRRLANYASFGKNNVDIAAYGFVETPTLGDTLALASGTSLAAPHITRTAAIIKGLFPNLTAGEIKDCILSTAAAEADFANKVATGGILAHDAAIDCAYQKAGDCVAIDLYITIPQTLDTIYRSDVYVNTDATITNNSDVEVYGAEHVTMLPGFETIIGTEYLADIDDCDPLNAPLTPEQENEASFFRMRDNSVLAGKVKLQFYTDGDPVMINITDSKNGSVIESYKFDPGKKGWYEKIIDAKLIPSGMYNITADNILHQTTKAIQIYNPHQEKYVKRNKARTEE